VHPDPRGSKLLELWNDEEANRVLRAALAEVDALADQLSPARAEALLDEFEQDITRTFIRHDISALRLTCEEYHRRFRVLSEQD
jgi:hypothetical protein